MPRLRGNRPKLRTPRREDEVRALISVGRADVTQGDALLGALTFFLEKNHPDQKAQRAQRRAEKKAEAEKKALARLEEGWDEERAHPQVLAINRHQREREEVLAAQSAAETEALAPHNEKRTIENEHSAHHRWPIAASVKHQVWLRDGGRCTWLSEDGRRCTARHYLQYDHIKMVCQGGSNEADNLRLRCAAHNRLAYTLHANAREERPTLASQEASPVKMIETRKRGHNKIPTKRLF